MRRLVLVSVLLLTMGCDYKPKSRDVDNIGAVFVLDGHIFFSLKQNKTVHHSEQCPCGWYK